MGIGWDGLSRSVVPRFIQCVVSHPGSGVFFAMMRGVCVKQSAQRLARCYGLPCSTVPERRVGLHAQPVVRLDDGSVVYWSRRSDLNLRFLRLPAGTNFPPEAPLPLPPEPV